MVIEPCEFRPGEEKVWDEFVQRSDQGSHCHLSGWKRVIELAYGHRSFYLMAHENGQTKGILPLILMRSRFFGKSLVSLPFLDDGGMTASDAESSTLLYREAIRLYEDSKADSLEFRNRWPSNIELPTHGSKVTLRLNLASSPDQMWKLFDAKLRNQIRKSLKSGITATWAGAEGLSDFYGVFATNMRDLGSPVHSQRFFGAILNEFPDSAKFILVHKGSQAIGGGLCLWFKDTLFMPWASSNRKYASLCPNNLLYWEVIRWGCEKGYRLFDFGRSSRGSGTYRFKKQWGAVEEPLNWQIINRAGKVSVTVQSDDPRYRWAANAWKHLPLTVANSIGPVLRKQISN